MERVQVVVPHHPPVVAQRLDIASHHMAKHDKRDADAFGRVDLRDSCSGWYGGLRDVATNAL